MLLPIWKECENQGRAPSYLQKGSYFKHTVTIPIYLGKKTGEIKMNSNI